MLTVVCGAGDDGPGEEVQVPQPLHQPVLPPPRHTRR